MGIKRATFFFKSSSGYGWSETLFSNVVDLTTVMARAQTLLPLRVSLNGSDCQLAFIRVSDDSIFRDSLIFSVPRDSRIGKNPDFGECDIPNTCFNVSLRAGALYRRELAMRGIPDNMVTKGGEFDPSAQWRANFTAWVGGLIAGAWGIRAIDNTVAAVGIAGLLQDPNAPYSIGIITGNAHNLAINDEINITKLRGARQVRGRHRVFSITSPTGFSLHTRVLIDPYTGGGLVRKVSFNVFPITSGQVMRVSHREAGRPFDSPTGRHKALLHI